jgi:hypothetical protein
MTFLSPRKQTISNILINSAWGFLSGVLWSIIIIVLTILLSTYFDVVSIFEWSDSWTKISPMFPFILSLITLFWTTITSFLTYHILTMTDSERYKKNRILFWQLALFQVICYILLIWIYIYVWINQPENITYPYIFHVILTMFWTSLILEVFNNYRYILTWIYWTIIGLFLSVISTIFVFSYFPNSYAQIIILILLLPFTNFVILFFKQIFELAYYQYYKFSSLDPLWDIFYQIELEEERKEKLEEEKNTI